MIASPKTPGGVKSSLFLSEQNHLFPIAISELNHLFLSFIGTKVILFTCWVDLLGVIIITVLLSRLVRTVSCPPGHLPPCCLASILDSDPVGCLLPTSPHAPHIAQLLSLIGETEELSAADTSSPHRGFVGLGFSSRAFPFSTKNGVPKSKLTSCCLGMLFPSRRYVLSRFHRMSR